MSASTALPAFTFDPTLGWEDYALLDSGDGKTLERFGPYTLIRPEAQAIWAKGGPANAWKKADALRIEESKEYGGRWQFLKPIEKSWQMSYKSLRFQVKVGTSRHIGVFPEQAPHWDFIMQRVQRAAIKPFKVLNLFGYTGMATLAATAAGAEVTHVDSSKHALSWASYNLKLNGLQNKPVHWIAEDALKFASREARQATLTKGSSWTPLNLAAAPTGKFGTSLKKCPAWFKPAVKSWLLTPIL